MLSGGLGSPKVRKKNRNNDFKYRKQKAPVDQRGPQHYMMGLLF
jgi:hypothetical protein